MRVGIFFSKIRKGCNNYLAEDFLVKDISQHLISIFAAPHDNPAGQIIQERFPCEEEFLNLAILRQEVVKSKGRKSYKISVQEVTFDLPDTINQLVRQVFQNDYQQPIIQDFTRTRDVEEIFFLN